MPSAANYSKLRQHIVGCGVRRHRMFSSAATLDQTPILATASPDDPIRSADGGADVGVGMFEPEASRREPISKSKSQQA
jgi:hypothetical protein